MNLEIKGDIKFSRYVIIVYSYPSCYKTCLKDFIIIFLSTFVDILAKKKRLKNMVKILL
jgi:hypothetical protein